MYTETYDISITIIRIIITIITVYGRSCRDKKNLWDADDGCQTGVGKTRAGEDQEQGRKMQKKARSKARAGEKQEEGKSKVGTGQGTSLVEQTIAERGQKLGRSLLCVSH